MKPNRPSLDSQGLAQHGAAWGRREEVVLRALSRGPGVPVEVQHPRNGQPPRRVVSGDGEAYLEGGRLFVKPRSAAAGVEVNLIVEM